MGPHINWLVPALAFVGTMLLRLFSGKRIGSGTFFTGLALAGGSFLAVRALNEVQPLVNIMNNKPNKTEANHEQQSKQRFDEQFPKIWWHMQQRGDSKKTDEFLQQHIEILQEPDLFEPPLICIVAQQCHKKILGLLLSRNPDLARARDCDGKTPLHYAVKNSTTLNAELLLFGDSSIGIPEHRDLAIMTDNAGRPPIFDAIDHDDLPNFKFMQAEFPTLLSIHNHKGQSVLHYAINKKAYLIVQHLSEGLADGNTDSLKQLLSSRNSSGLTPLDLAKQTAEDVPDEITQEIYELLLRTCKRLGIVTESLPMQPFSETLRATSTDFPSTVSLSLTENYGRPLLPGLPPSATHSRRR